MLKWENKDPILTSIALSKLRAKTKSTMLFNVYMKEMLDNSRGKRCEFYVF